MVTASMIFIIIVGSAILATPPAARISAGTLSRAITAHAPASSAIFACSGVVTSMITPPFNISARPFFTVQVPFLTTKIPPIKLLTIKLFYNNLYLKTRELLGQKKAPVRAKNCYRRSITG
jgi:hypothetical protein